jgi:hypothetical protein
MRGVVLFTDQAHTSNGVEALVCGCVIIDLRQKGNTVGLSAKT